MTNASVNNIIGWCNSDEDTVLCKECFDKLYKDRDIKWLPIRKGEDNSYTCDECEKNL